MKLTPFGLRVRQLRLELGLKLKEMADALGNTSAYLSAVETGKKPANEEIVERSIQFFANYDVDASDLRAKADESREAVNVEGLGSDERGAIAAFARQLPGRSQTERKEMLEKLKALMESRGM